MGGGGVSRKMINVWSGPHWEGILRKTTYQVLVRPRLEYVTCAWSPHTKTDIQKVEQVQCFAVCFITGDYWRTSSATAMCANLMWDALHTRRCIHHGQVRISLSTIIVTSTRSMFALSQCGIRSPRKQSLHK